MKKSVFILTAALSFGMAAAQQAPAATTTAAQVPTLTDVPAGHWAKDAIDQLVSKGILLGYPDGTFRGNQNLTRNEAAIIIARLLNQMGNGQVAGLDAETLTSLQNAVQELSADLAALGVRVSDLEENAVSKEDFTRLEERVEALDGSSDLQGAASRFDELSSNYDTLRADVDDNASSIAALNDLTVLLNQDILNLQDRASALEAAQADFVTRTDFDALSTSVKSIDGRVTTLENGPKFSIGGTLSATYGQVSLKDGSAGDFDLDLVNRNTFIDNFFSNDPYCATTAAGTLVYARGNSGVRCVDTTNGLNGIDAIVTFGVSNIHTSNGLVNVDSAHVTMQAKHTTDPAATFGPNSTLSGLVASGTDTYAALSHADVNGSTSNGVKFRIAYDDGNNSNSNFKFNDYLFANDNDTDSVNYRRGVITTVDASALSSLSPKVTIVAGSSTPQLYTKTLNGHMAQYPNIGSATGAATAPALGQLEPLVGAYFGIRATITPYNLGTIGLSYAQGNLANPYPATFVRRDAVSADADLKIGPVSTQGVFVASYPTTAADGNLKNANKAGYVKFGVDISGVKVHANYHYIDPAFDNGVAGMSTNDSFFYLGMGKGAGYKSGAPFGPNEDGYGADASFNVGPVNVAGYINSFKSITDQNVYSWYLNGARQTAYGVKLGTSVIRGLSVSGFYNDARVGDVRMTELFGADTYWNNTTGYIEGDFDWANTTSMGVALHHNGKDANALVKGLNIDATYARLFDDVRGIQAFKYNDVVVSANYDGKFSVLNIKPFVRYHYFGNPNAGLDLSTAGTAKNYTDGSVVNYEGSAVEQYNFNSVKVGVQASTDPLDVVTKPSVYGNISYRNTKYDGKYTVASLDTTTELLANVGLTLNEFLLPDNKLSVGYSYYKGENVDNHNYYDGVSRYYKPFDSGSDIIAGSSTNLLWFDIGRNLTNREVSGVYGQWEAWGLKAAYGVYRYKNLNTNLESTAQAFKVSAKLNF